MMLHAQVSRITPDIKSKTSEQDIAAVEDLKQARRLQPPDYSHALSGLSGNN